MAKDFYKYGEDGVLMHKVVMGMTKYKDYWAAGWSNSIPEKPLVPETPVNPFDGMDQDEDMKEIFEKKIKKAK